MLTVVSMVRHKQTESWILGEAAEAHWAQGWASHVAAEPLQNELLARALPTGNVSSLAMWNRFQLEGTRAQSRCLETQLSVPFFFQVASTVEKTLTCILCHRTIAGECTEDLNKTTVLFNSLTSSVLLPDTKGIRGPWSEPRFNQVNNCEQRRPQHKES